MEKEARIKGRKLNEQVYGKEHVEKKHRCGFYKPRYLRRVDLGKNEIKAYPNGLKEWNEGCKVHLVGHSLGGQTIRYLQYLLKIGYFEDEYKGIDRSNWIASISCIS